MAARNPAKRRAELRELRSRGMQVSAAQWDAYTYTERQNILRQSRARARITRRAGLPAAQRRRNARARARRYAAKMPIVRKQTWPEDEEADFWHEYGLLPR